MRPVLTTKTVVEQQNYNFGFDYLSKEFVKVIIGDTELNYPDDYYVNGTTVTLKVKPNEVKPMIIYRKTSTIPLVKWQDGSVMTAKDMNLQELQALHINEETEFKHEDVRRWYHLVQEGKQRVEDKVKEISDTLDHVLQLAGGDVYTRTETDSKLDAFKKELEDNDNKTFIITHPLFDAGDIESGDCTIIGINGKWVIIDFLTDTDAHKQAITERMGKLNINKFDIAILTHYHADHVGNLPWLLKENKIVQLFLPDTAKTEVIGSIGMTLEQLENIKKKIVDANSIVGTPIETITAKTIEFNGATIEFYNCTDEDYNYYREVGNQDYNNVSVGVEVNYLQRTVLIEGDFTYLAMERNALRNPTNVDYLKSNHHGINEVPLVYRKVNPKDLMMTTTTNSAVDNLIYYNFQNVFRQMGSNIYLLGDQIEPPMITYKGDGSVTYNRGLIQDGEPAQASALRIYIDQNYEGRVKTGDLHTPFTHLIDAIRFINQSKQNLVTVKIKPGDYTRTRDKGKANQNRQEIYIRGVYNNVTFERDGSSGIVNLPPMVIERCRSISFKNVEFMGVSSRYNRKIDILDSKVTLSNVKANGKPNESNSKDATNIVRVNEDSFLFLNNVDFREAWGAIYNDGGTVLLSGAENHVEASHAYVLSAGTIIVQTPFVEKNTINKSNDLTKGEAGQVIFRPVDTVSNIPTNITKGTIIPIKNMNTPHQKSFIQGTKRVWTDTVYSIVNPISIATPDYTGQIGINGEEVFIGANNKWIKISN